MERTIRYTIPQKRLSHVWDHFTGEGSYACCNYCNRQVKYCGGTSNLQNHLKRCPSAQYIAQFTNYPKMDEHNHDSFDSVELVGDTDPGEMVSLAREAPKTFKRRIGQTEITINRAPQQQQRQQPQQQQSSFSDNMFGHQNTEDDSVEVLSDCSNDEGSDKVTSMSIPVKTKMLVREHPPAKKVFIRSVPPTHTQQQQPPRRIVGAGPPPTFDHIRSFFKAMEDTVRTFPPMQQADAKNQIFALVSAMEMKHLAAKQCPSATSSANQSPMSHRATSSVSPVGNVQQGAPESVQTANGGGGTESECMAADITT